ncbi:uncharacterized protein LOC124896033 [Capsicum annuum]|uniref:uncharacterized protein LOC124896033 n=1 Tax=Capsicum annuum TaxID=4072 RepID=UPI001FB13E87|nr:uncharacterized protein LOC124896033 [Capsicum annuum]
MRVCKKKFFAWISCDCYTCQGFEPGLLTRKCTFLTTGLCFSSLSKVIPASEYIYTIHDMDKHFIVCLKKKKCSCHAFQLDEILCVHVCAVLDSKSFQKGPYCYYLYKLKIVLRTYDLPIYPLQHKMSG